MWQVGLTGGIASGKSTVGRLFTELGVAIIDADRIAHQVVEPGTPGLAAVAAAFGADVLGADGALDRDAMRQRVFADPAGRKKLEAIVHPLVRNQMRLQVAAAAPPYCILDIPLLVESGYEKNLDRVLVVDIPVAMQRFRLRQRDGSSDAQIDNILAAQAGRQERLAVAHDVIDNSGKPEALRPLVDKLHSTYIVLATASTLETPT